MEIDYYYPMARKDGPVDFPYLRDQSNWPSDPRDAARLMLEYLKATPESKWLMGHVRSKDGQQHCALSWAFQMAGNAGWDRMETMLCGLHEIFAINDGKHPDYPVDLYTTPKSRIIAAIQDYCDGKRKDIYEELDDFFGGRSTEEQE